MTKLRIFFVTLIMVLLALRAFPVESAPGRVEVRQWQVNNSDTVTVGTPYELHNTRRRQLDLTSQLGYKKTKLTLATDMEDIGWMGHAGGHFEFRRSNARDHRAISPDETLALYNTKSRKYLLGSMSEKNIANPYVQDWSSSPSYEWMVHDRQGADFALYNTKKRDYFVLGGTFKGVDATLTWFKSLK